jgi:hypothetical protein
LRIESQQRAAAAAESNRESNFLKTFFGGAAACYQRPEIFRAACGGSFEKQAQKIL